ncbi:MAG: phosphoesterase [Rhodobacteraceae bacterium]|nr:phosphoesterase [Paracoccaceae bacterium]MBR9822557.1 phosphoesterase [Paracoccaceae bacterium]
MLIVQLSDLHLRDDGAYPRHDPAEALARAFEGIARMRPAPALILLTGDVIDRSAAGYGPACALLRQAPVPLVALSGNHDRAAEFRAALGDRADFAEGHLSFALPLDGLTVIGLDSNRAGGLPGVDAARLDWLAGVLEGARGNALLALHHPPFATGIPRLDGTPFEGAEALEALVRGSAVTRVIAGHTHREITATWAGVTASTGPALAHGLALSLVGGAPHAHTPDAPGMHLHQVLPDGRLVTHRVDLDLRGAPEGFAATLGAEELGRLVY